VVCWAFLGQNRIGRISLGTEKPKNCAAIGFDTPAGRRFNWRIHKSEFLPTLMKTSLIALALTTALVAGAAVARAADGADTFAHNCKGCHGADGAGHTKAGRMVGVKDLTSAEYQKSFTDADASARIKNGLKDASGKVKMKAFGDTLSDSDIKDLVAFVRSLQK